MAIELPKRVAESIDRFTGREWLLPKVLEWWDNSHERFFLLTGGPGTGKSMVLGWLSGFGAEPEEPAARSQLARVRKAVTAAHFCQAASRNVTPQAFAESIANQLTNNVRGFAEAFTETLAERVVITMAQAIGTIAAGGTAVGVSIGRIELGTLGDELSFDRAFTQPLKQLYASGHKEPMLILLDSLDEADTYDGIKIQDLLSRISDLPAPIRILATTRDEPRVLKFFRGIQPIDLIRDANPNVDAVRIYTERRLANLTGVEPSKGQEFAQRLSEQAGGVFLYAAMVLDEILERPLAKFPELDSLPLPDCLSSLYHEFLIRELGKDEQQWFELYEPLLGVVAVSHDEGLNDHQLTDIIGKDIRGALRKCKQYLSGDLPNGPFRLYHKSFADFLLKDDQNADFHIDLTTMHQRIADHYWSHRQDWSKCDEYGLNHLATHLSSSNRIADLVTLINYSWMQVRFKRAGFTYSKFQADIDTAWKAVQLSTPPLDYLIHLKAAALAIQERVKIYEDEDLSILVEFGRWEEALEHTNLRNTPEKRFKGYLTIYRAVLQSSQSSIAMKLFDKAHVTASEIGDLIERVRALCSLMREPNLTHCSRPADLLNELVQCISDIQDKNDRTIAEREYAVSLLEAQLLEDAERVAGSIDDDVQKAFALEAIAISLADRGDFRGAERVLGSMKVTSIFGVEKAPVQRIHVKILAGIARAMAAVDGVRAIEMLEDAERAAKSIEDMRYQDEALEDVTAALAHSGHLSKAMQVAVGMRDWRKSNALLGLVSAHSKRGDFPHAEALIQAIPDVEWHGFALREIATALAAQGRYDEARSFEEKIDDLQTRAFTLGAIADALMGNGDQRATDVLGEAMKLSAQIESTSDKKAAFRRLTRLMLRGHDLHGAHRAFEQVLQHGAADRDDREYCDAVRETAIALGIGRHDSTPWLIGEVSRTIERLHVFDKGSQRCELAVSLSRLGRFATAWRVLESDTIDFQQGEFHRGHAWCELATDSTRKGWVDLADLFFEKALTSAQKMGDDFREELLAKVAAIFIKHHRFERAEGTIALLTQGNRRCEMLAHLAVALHQNNPIRASQLLALVEDEAWKGLIDRDNTLVALVFALADSREFDDAFRVVSTIQSGNARVNGLCHLAEQLVLAGDPRGQTLFSEGLRLANKGNLNDQWLDADRLREEAAVLAYRGDMKAAALWARAHEAAGSLWVDWLWDDNQYRAEGILDIAAALARSNDPRADSTLDLAYRTAIATAPENARDKALRNLLDRLISLGRLETAEQTLLDINRDSDRVTALQDLVQAYISASKLDRAWHLARSLTSYCYRRDTMRNIAVAFASANRIREAIQALEEPHLDGFIGAVAMVHAAWSAAPTDVVLASIRAVTGVAAWVRSDWNEVNKSLMTS